MNRQRAGISKLSSIVRKIVDEKFFHALPADELAPNTNKAVDINGVDVLICNAAGEFHAIANLCPHQASALEGGRVRGCFIACPLHGVRFDLRDGSPKGQLTNRPVKVYKTRVVDGNVEVCLD